MKISVCMITYNHEAFIEEAIQSIITQKGIDYDDFEIVIGEDLSLDKTREICQIYADKYPKNIKLLPRTKNIGMLQNFYETLKACSGEYIALCEGDDFWTNSYKLHKQVKILENNPQYSFCFHKGDVLIDNRLETSMNYKRDIYSFKDFAIHGCFLKTMSVVFRRKDLDIKYFETKEYSLMSGADQLLYLILTMGGKPSYCINETMGVYRHHPGGVWSALKNSEKIDMIEKDAFLYRNALPLTVGQAHQLNLQFKRVICARFVMNNKIKFKILRKILNGIVNYILFIFGAGLISSSIISVYYYFRGYNFKN